jgi:glycosyltransferase involved in cell wall biosynthesis
MRGGERVIEQLCRLYPDADIYTHVFDPERISDTIKRHRIECTSIAGLPFARKFYKMYLGFMPRALEHIDLTGYDLVISSESGPAKGVIAPPNAHHICYCHSPMRYIWDYFHPYRSEMSFPARAVFDHVAHRLRQWDVTSAARVDRFVANSAFVANRIQRYYGRSADVIHPPVSLDTFRPVANPTRDFYLIAGEIVPYKRVDLAIEAFRGLNCKLVIAGRGSAAAKLQRHAPDNVEFMGRVSDDELAGLYANCRALVFPGEEDFGLVPLEVMASGRPVIAYGSGGALESVKDLETGLFFRQHTVESLRDAITRFELIESKFRPERLRAHAEGYSEANFRAKFRQIVDSELSRSPRSGSGVAAPVDGVATVTAPAA